MRKQNRYIIDLTRREPVNKLVSTILVSSIMISVVEKNKAREGGSKM
jgi:hypothetical protein